MFRNLVSTAKKQIADEISGSKAEETTGKAAEDTGLKILSDKIMEK